MNRRLAGLITAALIAAVGVLTPTTSPASGRPAPSVMERFYCHRVAHPVPMHHHPKQPFNWARCLQRPKAAAAPTGSRPSMRPAASATAVADPWLWPGCTGQSTTFPPRNGLEPPPRRIDVREWAGERLTGARSAMNCP